MYVYILNIAQTQRLFGVNVPHLMFKHCNDTCRENLRVLNKKMSANKMVFIWAVKIQQIVLLFQGPRTYEG